MAIFQCTIYSEKLMQNTQVNVILPLPNVSNMEDGDNLPLPAGAQKYQTLWLLHCGTGDQNEFLRFSRIEEYAQKKLLAVVMPNVGNSYYCNLPHGGGYYDYYTEELPRIMRAVFPLSEKREDNFIGGASMGGFGAFAAALRNPGNYAAAFSLSGGLIFRDSDFGRNVEKWQLNVNRTIFGEHEEYYNAHIHDLETMANDFAATGRTQPLLYAVNGKQDGITSESTPRAITALKNAGLTITYVEEDGGHGWDLWDPQLRKILDWLPLANGFV